MHEDNLHTIYISSTILALGGLKTKPSSCPFGVQSSKQQQCIANLGLVIVSIYTILKAEAKLKTKPPFLCVNGKLKT